MGLGRVITHNLLLHFPRVDNENSCAGKLLSASETAAQDTHKLKEAADRYAVRLAIPAGYDLTKIEAFMGGLLYYAIVGSARQLGTQR